MKNGVDYNHEQDDEYKYCHVKRYQQNERDFLVWPNGRSTLDQPPPSFFSLVIFNFALFFYPGFTRRSTLGGASSQENATV